MGMPLARPVPPAWREARTKAAWPASSTETPKRERQGCKDAAMSSPRHAAAVRPDETERVRRITDKQADGYDRQIALFERILFGDGRAWVCSQARGCVLELACGTGRNLPFYPQEAELTGIELSPAMLAI